MDIGAAVTSFGLVIEGLKLVKDVNDVAKRNEAVIDLQTKILAMQSSYVEMVAKLSEVQEKLKEAEDWNKEAGRYELKDFGQNTFAYEIRADQTKGEPIHKLCAVCFQEKRKSVLQFHLRTVNGQDIYKCNKCKTDFPLGVRQESRPFPAKKENNWVV